MSGWDLGPESVGAIATAAATIVALSAVIIAVRSHRSQIDDLDLRVRELSDAREAARRAQADGVAAWWPTDRAYNDFEVVMLTNTSAAPVYDVEVFAQYVEAGTEGRIRHLDVVVPGETPRKLEGAEVNWLREQPFDRRPDGDKRRPHLAIQFRDAAGIVWHRDRHGRIAEGPRRPF